MINPPAQLLPDAAEFSPAINRADLPPMFLLGIRPLGIPLHAGRIGDRELIRQLIQDHRRHVQRSSSRNAPRNRTIVSCSATRVASPPLAGDQLQFTADQRLTIDQLIRIGLPRHARKTPPPTSQRRALHSIAAGDTTLTAPQVGLDRRAHPPPIDQHKDIRPRSSPPRNGHGRAASTSW